jgi:protein-S-isoprenylcysteine O-methyltransferase Ste14
MPDSAPALPSSFVFRYRFLIFTAIIVAGFLLPGLISPSSSTTTWMLAAGFTAHRGWLSMQSSSFLTGAVALTFAVAAALIRTWATAFIGADVMLSSRIHTHTVVAAGPYRYLRNPLYLGLELHFVALALLMPLYGAIFSLIAGSIFLALIIRAEESRLAATPGYKEYAARVPRLIPSLTPRTPPSAARPHWARAFLSEIYYWGVALSFAIFLTQYNTQLIVRGVLLSLGVSLVVRSFIVQRTPAATP